MCELLLGLLLVPSALLPTRGQNPESPNLGQMSPTPSYRRNYGVDIAGGTLIRKHFLSP
jgi:hypothetical protein